MPSHTFDICHAISFLSSSDAPISSGFHSDIFHAVIADSSSLINISAFVDSHACFAFHVISFRSS